MSTPMKQKMTGRAAAVALGCALLLFFNTGIAQTIGYSFYVPMAADMGINMGLLTYMVTFQSVAMMIFCLFYGKLLKKFSLKWLMAACGALLCISWAVQASAHSAPVVWIAGAIRGISSIFAANMTVSIVLLNWFNKGTVMAVINTMDNLAPALLSVPVAAAVEKFGWRPVGYGIGIASLVATIVVAFVLIRLTPQECGQQQVGSVIGEVKKVDPNYVAPGISAKEALRSPKLYLVMFVAMCMLFLGQGMAAQRTGIIMSMNLTYVQASLAVSITSIFGVIFQITFGALTDKWGVRVATTFCGVVYVIAMLLGLFAPRGILFFGILYGVCTSTMANSSIYPSLAVKEVFGMRDLATIAGWVQTAMLIGGILGGVVISSIYTAKQEYTTILITAMIVAILVVVFGLIANRKKNRFVAA